MRGRQARAALLATLLMAASPVAATHISGGEIFYECLGNDQYAVTVIVYRDCFGVPLDNTIDLVFDSPCDSFTVTLDTPSPVELSQLCDLELPNSTCNGGTLPGIEQYTYTTVVTLPPCATWTIGWIGRNRNAAVANLVDPDDEAMFIATTLNNTVDPCDNSPVLTNIASPYVCLNYPVTYSYGGFDPDGDSLSYALVDALDEFGQPIAYIAPYTGTQPIAGLTLDPVTGLLSFTPMLAGNWVVVVEVSEWDAMGNLIGTVMRDMQFIAYPCSNVPPDPATGTINGFSGTAVQTGPNSVEVCESGSFCMSFDIADLNAANVLEATTNLQQNLPGATFSYTGTNPITCTVCWNGQPGTSGFFPFIVQVNDGACPIPAVQTYVYAITVLPGMAITVDAVDESCAGQLDGQVSVNITAGTAPFQYTWAGLPDTTASVQVGAGSYAVTVTDANGCVSQPATAVVNAQAQPNQADAGPDQLGCPDALPLVLTGSVTNATGGVWSGGQGAFSGSGLSVTYQPTANEFAAGGVDLILTTTGNPLCAAAVDTVHVVLSDDLLNATVAGQDVLCNGGATGAATFQPVLPGMSFVWSAPGAPTTPQATGLPAGTYSITVADAAGCDTTLSVTIGQPPPLQATLAQSGDPLCAGGANGWATVTATGGTPGHTYQWDAAAGNQVGPTASGLGAGTFGVTVTDANGCIVQLSAQLSAPPPIVLSAQAPDTVCVNVPVTLTAQATGGTGSLLVTWSGIGTGTPLTHAFSTSQTVVVTAVDANGCSATPISLPVTVLDLNDAQLVTGGAGTVCPGDTAFVSAQVIGYPGTVQLLWPQLGLAGPGPHAVAVPADMVLTVTATDQCGNTLQGQVPLAVDVPPTVVLPPVFAEGCAPLTVQFPDTLASGNLTWLWDFGDGTTSTAPAPVHVFQAGTFAVGLTVTTALGCSSTAPAPGLVIAHAPPTAAFTASTTSTDIDHALIHFTNGSSGSITGYAWDLGDGTTSDQQDVSHQYLDVGLFTVALTVTDVQGCSDTAWVAVEVTPDHEVVIPTGFTPNPGGGSGGVYDPNDLNNDVFYPFARFVEDFRMRVYNRWGELIFESLDIQRGWDGYYRGQLSPQDVYVYQVWLRFVDGQERQLVGDITLFR